MRDGQVLALGTRNALTQPSGSRPNPVSQR
jgi:hypothetical protein